MGELVDLRSLHFGVEVEFGGLTRHQARQVLATVVGGHVYAGYSGVTGHDGRVWSIVKDASLKNFPEDLRCELVTPICSYEDLPRIAAVVDALRKAGAVVDEKCGIHIHVDAETFSGQQLATLAKLTYQQEPLIYAALGISQERQGFFAKRTDPEFIARLVRSKPRGLKQMNRLWYGKYKEHVIHYDSTRYRGVNFHAVWDKGTVEFRWFESTLVGYKVTAYVQFVLAVAAKAFNARGATCRQREYDPSCAKYDWRVFLLRLGLIGDEFKVARKVLLALMPGDAAFKKGRPARKRNMA